MASDFEDRVNKMAEDMKDEQDAVQASLNAIAERLAKEHIISITLAKAMVDGAMLLLQDYVSERTQIMQTLSADFSALPEDMRPTALDKEDARRDGWLLIMRLQNLTAYHARMWEGLLPLLAGGDENLLARAHLAVQDAMRRVQALLVEQCERVWRESLNTTAAGDAVSEIERILALSRTDAAKGTGGGNDTLH